MSSNKTFTIPLAIIGVIVVVGIIAVVAQGSSVTASIDSSIAAYASEVGLDMESFGACLNSRESKTEALSDYDDGVALGVNSTPSFFVNGLLLNGARPFEEFQAVIESEIAGTTPDTAKRVNVSVDDDPVKGDFSAPVTIVEFSDYECPYCKRYFDTTLPLIQSEFIDTGKVKYVFRDFPIVNLHPHSVELAAAANCAKEQGKYWEMHDILFAKQEERR